MGAVLYQTPFAGVENPLSESGIWVTLTTTLNGINNPWQKNNGNGYGTVLSAKHASGRCTKPVYKNHWSEMTLGALVAGTSNIGVLVAIQPSGPTIDSCYLAWLTAANANVFRLDMNGTTYTATQIINGAACGQGDVGRISIVDGRIFLHKNKALVGHAADATYTNGYAGILYFADAVAL